MPEEYRYVCDFHHSLNFLSIVIYIRLIVTKVLGELEFNFYHRWFDVIFLVSLFRIVTVCEFGEKGEGRRWMYIHIYIDTA